MRVAQAVNLAGPETAQAYLCQAVCYPRLLLRCAALRQVICSFINFLLHGNSSHHAGDYVTIEYFRDLRICTMTRLATEEWQAAGTVPFACHESCPSCHALLAFGQLGTIGKQVTDEWLCHQAITLLQVILYCMS